MATKVVFEEDQVYGQSQQLLWSIPIDVVVDGDQSYGRQRPRL